MSNLGYHRLDRKLAILIPIPFPFPILLFLLDSMLHEPGTKIKVTRSLSTGLPCIHNHIPPLSTLPTDFTGWRASGLASSPAKIRYIRPGTTSASAQLTPNLPTRMAISIRSLVGRCYLHIHTTLRHYARL